MTKRNPTLHGPHTVHAAGIWDEGYCPYPGRFHGRDEMRSSYG